MVDLLIGAVGEKIRNFWGEEYAVYTESVHQGAIKPCFFVECEKAERVEMLNRRFFVRVTVKITFENDSDTKKYETENITAPMFDLLSLVNAAGGYFNGRKIYGKWEDGAFVIRCCYDIYTVQNGEETEFMETVKVKGLYDGG